MQLRSMDLSGERPFSHKAPNIATRIELFYKE